MGLIEWLTGWEYLGNSLSMTKNPKIILIHPDIIKKLSWKVGKNIDYKIKKWLKGNKRHAPLGRTIRGRKILPDFIGIAFVKGKTFVYKGKERYRYIDNHGHGGALSGGIKIWRKLRDDRR